jgi:large subunit ribosomal protein L17
MRHRKSFNHLSRKNAHRKAMLANMASSLIIHKRIKTTTAKAKELRTFVEPLITRSKEDSTHSRRMVFKYLGDKYAVSELFREVALKVGDRPGGYTRIIKIDNRTGDNADMCIIELVDYNENLLVEKETVKSKGARRRRGKKKTGVEDKKPAVAEPAEQMDEEPTGEAEEAVAESGDELTDTAEKEGREEEPATAEKEGKEEEPATAEKEDKEEESATAEKEDKEEESATTEKDDTTKDETPSEKEEVKDKKKTEEAREEKTKEAAETGETKEKEKPEDVKEESKGK